MKTTVLTLVSVLGVLGQTGLDAPRLGLWCDAQGQVRALYGVAGAFVPGKPLYSGALAAAWFGEGGWVLLPGRLLRLDAAGAIRAEAAVEPGANPVRFGPGAAQIGGQAFRWHGRSLLPEARLGPADFPEEPAWRDGRLRMLSGAALVLPAAPDRIAALGPGWWHISAAGHAYALAARPGREALWILPAPSPMEPDHALP